MALMTHLSFHPFPQLQTERLVLRQIEESDHEALFRQRTNAIVSKYIDRPVPKSKDDLSEFLKRIQNGIKENSLVYWAISEEGNPKLIGTICLWNFSDDNEVAEVGYELYPEFHGKGYMSEALKKVMDFGFKTLKFKAIEAFTHKDNEGSKKLLERHGFVLDEERRDEEFINNRIYIKTN